MSKAVRIACRVLGVLLLGAAAAVAFVPLPSPAAGGTCGPSASSESAAIAFFNPASIGAGPRPSATSGQRPQWQAFVDECQVAANTRVAVAGGIVIGAVLVAFGIPWVVERFDREDDTVGLPPAGWYPDPVNPTVGRWWDGRAWGSSHSGVPAQSASASAR